MPIDGAGYQHWYSIDTGPDRYAGTPDALKRGQQRVKLLATRRDHETEVGVGPPLSCGLPAYRGLPLLP